MTRRGRTRRDLIANLGLLVLSIVAALLLVEVLFRGYLRHLHARNSLERFVAHQERRIEPIGFGHTYALEPIIQLSADPRVIYELRSNLRTTFGGLPLETNDAGMRDDGSYARARPASTLRILGVGDSGMFGWDARQGRDYLAVLERRLGERKGSQSYEVLNLAVPGYNTRQEVDLLRTKGLAYEPQVVVVGWCVNDTIPPIFVYGRPEFDGWDRSYLFAFAFDRPRFVEMTTPPVRGLPRLVRDRRLGSTFVEDVAPDVIDPSIFSGTGRIGVRHALVELGRLADAHGFHALVFGPMEPWVEDICREIGIDFFNTLTIPAARHPEALIHHMHPDEAGHEVLAEHLERALERHGWLEPAG